MYDNAYLEGSLFWMVIWMFVYILLPRHRRAILWTSLLLAPAGPIIEYWSLQDYWNPVYIIDISIGKWHFGLEDYLLAFALAGVCAGSFESLAVRKGFPELPHISFRILIRMSGWGSLGLVLMFLLASVLQVGSIYSILLAVSATALLMLARKGQIFTLTLPLAIIFGLTYWIFYWLFFVPRFPGCFEALWNLEETWGIMWLGVPVEEVLWATVTMLYAGPILRVCSGRDQCCKPAPHEIA